LKDEIMKVIPDKMKSAKKRSIVEIWTL
jgi:hypothetical protein